MVGGDDLDIFHKMFPAKHIFYCSVMVVFAKIVLKKCLYVAAKGSHFAEMVSQQNVTLSPFRKNTAVDKSLSIK